MKRSPVVPLHELLFLLAVLLISTYLFFRITAKIQEKKVLADWAATFGPIEDLTKHFPARPDNDSAVQLKRHAVRLGIEFTVPGESPDFSPIYMDAKRHKLLMGPLASYINKQLEKADEGVDLPSELVASYLSDYKKELDALRNHVLNTPPILWRQNSSDWNLNRAPDSALPVSSGILKLQKVLVGRALELAARRDHKEAEAYLEAGWKLNQALRIHPDLFSQLIGLSVDYQWLGVIRKLPVSLDWVQKVNEHQYQESFLKAFQIEAWLIWRLRDQPISSNAILNPVLDPYMRFCVLWHLEKERQEIQPLQSLKLCTLLPDDFYEFRRYPKWNRVYPTSFWIFEKKTTLGRLIKLQIERELTEKIIRMRHGYFPPESSEWSEACENGTWAYHKLPDGNTSIEYAGPMERPYERRRALPISFQLRPSLAEE